MLLSQKTGERIVLVFEGRDAAGKGGTIRAITERVSPRIFRVVALPSPLDRVTELEAVFNGRTTTPDEIDAVVNRVDGPAVVLMDDAEQLLDTQIAIYLEGLLRGSHDGRRAVVLAGGLAELNAMSFRGLVAEARKSRAGLLLSPSAPGDAELFGVRLPKTATFSGPAGRAVQIVNGSHRLVQIAEATNDDRANSA